MLTEADAGERLDRVLSRIADATRRRRVESASSVSLLAVSKKQSVESMRALERAASVRGISLVFGENYVQEFAQKRSDNSSAFRAHLIGPLQSNKIRQAVGLFECIESVGALRTAELISKEAGRIAKRQRILLQINVSADNAKSGFSLAEISDPATLEKLRQLPGLVIAGLMTIPAAQVDPEATRADFRRMFQLFEKLCLLPSAPFHHTGSPSILSMGMSGDFEVAIEEGATEVRVGSALFGERQ